MLSKTSSESLLDELNNITEETSEVICNKAIELWQQYGSPLVFGDSRKEKTDIG